MTAVALNFSSDKILEVRKTANQDVAVAQKRVNFALTMLGHCLDFLGSWFVNRISINLRLEDHLVRLKGLVALVPDLDPNRVLDPQLEVARALTELQGDVSALHGAALKAREDVKLRRTHEAFREQVSLCAALYEVVVELKATIADHDSRATMGDHARRLIADLRRTDDVPAGRYAEIAAALRSARSSERRSQ